MGAPGGVGPAPGGLAGIAQVIAQVGFPVVVAGVLLWFLLTRFQETMLTITGRMEANTVAAGHLLEVESATVGELRAQTVELKAQTDLMRQFLSLRERQTGPKP